MNKTLKRIFKTACNTVESFGTFGDSSVERIREIAKATPEERMRQNWERVGQNLQSAINKFEEQYVKK